MYQGAKFADPGSGIDLGCDQAEFRPNQRINSARAADNESKDGNVLPRKATHYGRSICRSNIDIADCFYDQKVCSSIVKKSYRKHCAKGTQQQ